MSSQHAPGPVHRLGFEILDILLALYFLRRQDFGDDPLGNLRETKVAALLLNDIIIRLGKFRDDDNRTWSFREVAKYLGKRVESAPRSAAAKPLIDKFVRSTRRLEDVRNLAIAHLSKRGVSHIGPLTEQHGLVGLAVEIVDALAGEENMYIVEGIDLRAELTQ